MLSYGFLIGKYNIFPYSLMTYFKKPFMVLAEKSNNEDKLITSSHVNFKLTEVNKFNSLNLIPEGGGLTTFKNEIIGVDSEGNFFKINQKNELELLNHITIKTNKESAIKVFKELNIKTSKRILRHFRVLDLVGLNENKLLISYQFFDENSQSKYFKIDVLNFDSSIYDIPQMKNIYKSKFKIQISKELQGPFYSNRNGGRIERINDDFIFFSLGDNQFDELYHNETSSQNLNSDFGKILKINIKTQEYEIYAKGLRNPQGLCLTNDNNLLTVGHGPQGGDELNVIKENGNYGWPYVTYGVDYGKNNWPLQQKIGRHEEYDKPIHVWLPSIAPSSMIESNYFVREWEGDFIITTLKEQSLYRIRIHNEKVIFSEKIYIGQRMRDLLIHKGKLFIWTDSSNILILEKDEFYKDTKNTQKNISSNLKNLIKKCIVCHQPNNRKSDNLPSLYEILDYPIASSGYKNYSNSLKRKNNLIWNKKLLDKYLLDPNLFSEDQSVMYPFRIEDEELRNELLNHLIEKNKITTQKSN
jgi:cytochrome c2